MNNSTQDIIVNTTVNINNQPSTCIGCIELQPNQMAHIGPGGCLEEAFQILENSK